MLYDTVVATSRGRSVASLPTSLAEACSQVAGPRAIVRPCRILSGILNALRSRLGDGIRSYDCVKFCIVLNL